jgi:elongation factor 1-gamma
MGKDNKTPEFLAKNPLGKVPVLETSHGCIFESNAIARYVARLRQDSDLYGTSFFESAQVDQWIDFCANELEPTRSIWLFPLMGFMKFDQEAYNSAKSDVEKSLKALESHLATRTYLVGHKVTLADIIIVSALVELYKRVFDPEFRKPFVNVTRWFTTCINQPEFAKVIGKVDFAQKEEVASGASAASGAQKGGKKEKQQKEQQPKKEKQEKQEKPKKEKKEDEGAAIEDEIAAEEKKKGPNPLDLLPPSSMILDATKKLYFEKRPNYANFFPEFWGFFDSQGYSFYFGEYNYNSENTIYFMTCNLVGGFIQRLDELRKYAFGVVNLLGKDEDTGPFPINSCFLFRGQDIPAEMKDCPDSEYYTWSKADTSKPDVRAKIEQYFVGPNINNLTVLERRYFK